MSVDSNHRPSAENIRLVEKKGSRLESPVPRTPDYAPQGKRVRNTRAELKQTMRRSSPHIHNLSPIVDTDYHLDFADDIQNCLKKHCSGFTPKQKEGLCRLAFGVNAYIQNICTAHSIKLHEIERHVVCDLAICIRTALQSICNTTGVALNSEDDAAFFALAMRQLF